MCDLMRNLQQNAVLKIIVNYFYSIKIHGRKPENRLMKLKSKFPNFKTDQ